MTTPAKWKPAEPDDVVTRAQALDLDAIRKRGRLAAIIDPPDEMPVSRADYTAALLSCAEDVPALLAEVERLRSESRADHVHGYEGRLAVRDAERWKQQLDEALAERDEARATKDMHKERQEYYLLRATATEAEAEELRRWKAEALEVLAGWDDVWVALGSPGRLGEQRSAGALDEVERLTVLAKQVEDLDTRNQRLTGDWKAALAEVERLRAALAPVIDYVTEKSYTTLAGDGHANDVRLVMRDLAWAQVGLTRT